MRPHKYKARPTVLNGIRYASKAEAAYAQRLEFELNAGEILWWLPQVKVQLTPDDRYAVDFLVQEKAGAVHAVDVKGVETQSFRRNKRLWKKYGPFPLRIVKNGSTVEEVCGE